MTPLPDTGERMVPELTDAATYREHFVRYEFACRYVRSRRVVDIACGEGYGTAAILKAGATSAIGMDISSDAIEHAKKKYGIDARLGSAEQIELPDRSVDVVVSFETLEHLKNPLKFLTEIKRILVPDGTLIVSTPNRLRHPDKIVKNPFHEFEMTEDEFGEYLSGSFSRIELYSQGLLQSPLLSLNAFASLRTSPSCRILSGSLSRLRRLACTTDTKHAAKTRSSTPDCISRSKPSVVDMLFDPVQIRRHIVRSGVVPIFFIAVASGPIYAI